jgi:hypothetical protein
MIQIDKEPINDMWLRGEEGKDEVETDRPQKNLKKTPNIDKFLSEFHSY